MTALAEVHRLKSEYLEAHTIHIELVRNTSAQQDPLYNAFALLNIAELDVKIGVDTLKVVISLVVYCPTSFSSYVV
ncbi:hypothetical protein C8R44DRAFT_871632 [Mycena epipterygia]|nr:hypothetical protein C8R44DRAFT_871632 [Mycena epipterygia]